jgi:DNA modification methylase
MINTVQQGDCLELMKNIPDKSIDCIITDPPYNIKKANWDSWKTVALYVNWLGSVFKEYQRVLKDNGSFYFFHNDFLQIVEIQNYINKNTNFVFKQFIVWNKKFKGCNNEGFLQGFIEPDGLRNYQKMAEYCLYYTFQDETGLSKVMLDENNFSTLRKYFKEFQEALGLNKKQIIEKIGQSADHCFRWGSSQWDLPTKETYLKLIQLPLEHEFIRKEYEELRKEYEELRKEYEELRKEYEELRYTFNNQKTHHSVWNYNIAKKIGHCTPKPVELIENIILHSTNKNDIILDSFAGSGTTAIACLNTNRNYILMEQEQKYIEVINKRITEYSNQLKIAP